MSRERRRALRFDSLEGKQLLSATPAAAPAAPPAHTSTLALDGSLSGTTHTVTRDTGQTETVVIPLSGTAGVLGNAKATLTEQIDEHVEAISQGTVVLESSRGSVTLAFTKPNALANLTVPYNEQFLANYRITSATGAYAGDAGTGVMEVTTAIGKPADIHLVLRPAK